MSLVLAPVYHLAKGPAHSASESLSLVMVPVAPEIVCALPVVLCTSDHVP